MLTLLLTALATAAVGDPLADVHKADFFTYFGWVEVGREGSVISYETKPEAPFHAYVKLRLTLTESGHVSAYHLDLDRAFLSLHGGVFAADVANSFVSEACPGSPKVVSRDPAWLGTASHSLVPVQGGAISIRDADGWVYLAAPGAPAPVPTPPAGFEDLFLGAADLPAMKRTQDDRKRGPDPDDAPFARHGGQASGMAVWMGENEAPVWRLVDIRWVFPSADAAKAYHEATLTRNAEGAPRVDGAPQVGEDCHVFGGTRLQPLLGADMTDFYYLFRVGPVVHKLYVAEGPLAKPGSLKVAEVAAIAAAAQKRALSAPPAP